MVKGKLAKDNQTQATLSFTMFCFPVGSPAASPKETPLQPLRSGSDEIERMRECIYRGGPTPENLEPWLRSSCSK